MKPTTKISILSAALCSLFSFSSIAQTSTLLKAEPVQLQVIINAAKLNLAEIVNTNALVINGAEQTALQQLLKQQDTFARTSRRKLQHSSMAAE
jgi:glutamine amidotransferase PdxT